MVISGMFEADEGNPPVRKICVFTGTRAEYGLLRPLISALIATPLIATSLLVTGAHLSEAHGNTMDEISLDGLAAIEKVAILHGDDSDLGVAGAMGRGLALFAAALARLKPDLLVVLGDRYEALAVACAATVCKVPIAHLHGGELSLGAMDDVFRHAITKLSHLHFCSTEAYRNRVIRMGEHPERVFNVGALGVENALNAPLLARTEVEARLGLRPGQEFAMMTFHPESLDTAGNSDEQITALLGALGRLDRLVTIATGANADAGGERLNARLAKEASIHPDRLRFRTSLGSTLYLSALKYCSLVIGNSSSGVIEAPSFGVPVIDIGSRQAGRLKASSIIAATADKTSVERALQTAMSEDFRKLARSVVNPYERPGTTNAIVRVISDWSLGKLLAKGFYDGEASFQPMLIAEAS
jgi:UDP-hydrolysing UDP-N-acetyl-D-glucosamine 2-epimerase